MAYQSEMARNAIQSDFQTSKMAAEKKKCDRKWILDIQNGRRQPFCQKFQKKIKVAYRSEMARNAIESDIWTSKMADVSHLVKNFNKNKSGVSMWNG